MANWKPKTIWSGDCLYVLRGMNSESVDLIYLDPPFNSNTNYAAPIGSVAAGAEFKDTWFLSDVDTEWINLMEQKHPPLYRVLLAAMTDSDKSYLSYMAVRIIEMRRVLKPTGSIYLHCDPTMSHYLKLVMDAVFTRKNFRNEIIWSYRRWPSKQKNFQRMHDTILRYARGSDVIWNQLYEPPSESSVGRFKGKAQLLDPQTSTRKIVTDEPTRGAPLRDVWNISIIAGNSKERIGYPTQKPLALIRRIIKASSNEGDIVLDPFCGCATTCVAAHELNREWIGIDVSPKAAELVVQRIRGDTATEAGGGVVSQGKIWREIIHRTDIPRRTDLGTLPPPHTHRNTLYGLQQGNCAGCNTHFQSRHLEVDHIIAVSKGGTDHVENLQLLCGSCNRIKGNRGMEYLRTKLQLR